MDKFLINMPKTKDLELKKSKKIVPREIDEEEVDGESVTNESVIEEIDEDDEIGILDDEVDPFKDKWEE